LVSSAYAIELLKRALEIYTPSRSEAQLANLIKEKCLDDLGFEKVNIDIIHLALFLKLAIDLIKPLLKYFCNYLIVRVVEYSVMITGNMVNINTF